MRFYLVKKVTPSTSEPLNVEPLNLCLKIFRTRQNNGGQESASVVAFGYAVTRSKIENQLDNYRHEKRIHLFRHHSGLQ